MIPSKGDKVRVEMVGSPTFESTETFTGSVLDVDRGAAGDVVFVEVKRDDNGDVEFLLSDEIKEVLK